jgi:hypothetical protein
MEIAESQKKNPQETIDQKVERLAMEMSGCPGATTEPVAPVAPIVSVATDDAPAESRIMTSGLFSQLLSNKDNPGYYEEMKAKIRNFSDIEADSGSVKSWGQKITLEEVAGKPVIFWGFKIGPSVKKNGTSCLTLLLELEGGVRRVLFTGSTVLSKLCGQYENKMPFMGKINKVKNYYVFE